MVKVSRHGAVAALLLATACSRWGFDLEGAEAERLRPASVFAYQPYFDGLLADNASTFDGWAASGDGATYYAFQYILIGLLGMFEGTADIGYLEQGLVWAESMVAAANIIDDQGYRNWAGAWASPFSATPIAFQNEELQGCTEMARLARLILTDAALTSTYGTRARAIRDFIKSDVIDKNVYRSTWDYFLNTYGGDPALPLVNRSGQLLQLVSELTGSGDATYAGVAATLAGGLTGRLVPFGSTGALIWDYQTSQPPMSENTAGGNGKPAVAVTCYETGIGVDGAHLLGMGRLFLDVIWDGSLTSPRFTNYVDGANDPYGSRPAWNNGLVYIGWAGLGAYVPEVEPVIEATLDAIIAGVNNPSLAYNDTLYGQMALSGHVTRNRARLAGF